MDALHRRILTAIALGPVAGTTGCGFVDADPADTTPELRSAAEAMPDAGDTLDEHGTPRIAGTSMMGAWMPDHLGVVWVLGAAPGAEVVLEGSLAAGSDRSIRSLRDVDDTRVLATARADAEGRATIKFRMPDVPGDVVAMDVRTTPSKRRDLTRLAKRPYQALVPRAELAHPGIEPSGPMPAADWGLWLPSFYRVCIPDVMLPDERCTPAEQVTGWRPYELAAFAFDRPLGPEIGLDVCGLELQQDAQCCYVMERFTATPGEPPPATCVPEVTDTAPAFDTQNWGGGWGWYSGLGRPLTTEDGPRLARAQASSGWTHTGLDLDAFPARARARAASQWTRAALAEHASVASFARFTLELLAVGAPADLVARASRAQADEVRHAREAFEVAGALSGVAVGPDALDLSGALPTSTSLADLVRATVIEGCVHETISAAQVAEAARCAGPHALRDVLQRTADDEGEHAALAWATVRWALTIDPSLADVVRDAFDEALHQGALPDDDDDALAVLGVLSPRRQAEVAGHVATTIVRPSAEALLASVGRA